MERTTSVDPAALDTGTLALFAGLALADAAVARIAAAGHPQLRFAHGFVVQHLIDGPIAVSDIAVRMGVTQQAASKSVRELADLGYVALASDAEDRRVRRASLTARGWEAVEVARKARADLERDLEADLGPDAIDAARRTLLGILDRRGGTEAIRRRRVRLG